MSSTATETVVAPEFDLDKLSPGQLAAVFAAFQKKQADEKAARKAARAETLKFLTNFVTIVAEKFPSRTFESGAVGWSMGGTVKVVIGKDDKGADITREARMNTTIRWVDTIPAKEAAEEAAQEAAESDDAVEAVAS